MPSRVAALLAGDVRAVENVPTADLATFDSKKGMGAANRGRYSNPKMDALLEQALATVDDPKREKLLQQATEIGIGDLGIITLHHQVNLWGTRKGLTYTPRTDERTLAHEFRPAQ